ncbi:hypothetical protein C8R45DRAFT_983537 [Mycena sanguinolenta]|nr:hypothetical protein C8R45DRAFT_983537 [Mycena sanguinolenta]
MAATPPLFTAPGPWLHLSTRSNSFDGNSAAASIANHFQVPIQDLQNFMSAVAGCNTWLARETGDWNTRNGVYQWAWKEDVNAVLGNSTRGAIARCFLPLIVADMLLHVSDPKPAPVVARASTRYSVAFSAHFLAQSDWTVRLQEAHTTYRANVGRLQETAAARGGSDKVDLLAFWASLKITNPLLPAVRNLTHVSIVLSLYLMGDVDLSAAGRASHLLATAKRMKVQMSPGEASTAVARTDIAKMMGPILVALAHSPLALLGQSCYASTAYSSRVALLETWRGLGNIHRVDLTDPLANIEAVLWRLLFKLALHQITELQVLELFYNDQLVRATIKTLAEGGSVTSRGLGYTGDILHQALEVIDVDADNDIVQITDKIEQEPAKKKRRMESPVPGAGPSRSLRERPAGSQQKSGKTEATRNPSGGSSGRSGGARRPTFGRSKATPSKGSTSSAAQSTKIPEPLSEEDGGDEEMERLASAISYMNLPTLAVRDGWKLPLAREVETLEEICVEENDRVMDPTLLYDLASEEHSVEIEYWPFEPAPDDASMPLVARRHKYTYRPFHDTKRDAEYLRNVVQSQRMKHCKDSNKEVPLHVHPDAQKFRVSGDTTSEMGEPLLPDIVPSATQSIVYVVHEDTWKSLTAVQHQEVLRTRAVLVVHRHPYLHDDKVLKFDEEGLEAFTHLDRLAFMQDLGARKQGEDLVLQVGRPRYLLICSKQRMENEKVSTAANSSENMEAHVLEADSGTPPQTQRLNLLGNTLQSTSVSMPSGWTDLASHEYACTWLEHLIQVPAFVFPWSEVTWKIGANEGAVSWLHTDVLFTSSNPVVGEKLWHLATRRTDLSEDDFRGIMRSRGAFEGFNGWTGMTEVWDFEQIHISPYTTLFMPATFPHLVISITDCIATGRHAIPISNVSHCVFVTLHNTLLAKSTTNADHEPARRFLVRMFIFIVLALCDPQNGAKGRVQGHPRLTDKTKAHLPDLATSNGVVDLLALRSFVVLVIALRGSSYPYAIEKEGHAVPLLPLETEEARELSLAWKLAYDLIDHVDASFSFERSGVPADSYSDLRIPTSFSEAALLSLVNMAVSMDKYVSGVAGGGKKSKKGKKSKPSLPDGFNGETFREQVKRMLVLFELHKGLSEQERRTQIFANPSADYKGLPTSPSAEFSRYVKDGTKHFRMLQPWDAVTVPFRLVPNQG